MDFWLCITWRFPPWWLDTVTAPAVADLRVRWRAETSHGSLGFTEVRGQRRPVSLLTALFRQLKGQRSEIHDSKTNRTVTGKQPQSYLTGGVEWEGNVRWWIGYLTHLFVCNIFPQPAVSIGWSKRTFDSALTLFKRVCHRITTCRDARLISDWLSVWLQHSHPAVGWTDTWL